jgi:8-oxo-dGTP diphosphatase
VLFRSDAKVGQFIASSKFAYSHASIELLAYEAEIVSGELSLKDHKEIRWVSREHLKSYDFPEADWPIIEKIVSSRG